MNSLLIYNLNSGKSKVKKDLPYIVDFFNLKKWKLTLISVEKNMDLSTYVTSIAGSFDLVIIAGGDGTVHSVVNGLMKLDIEIRPKVLLLPYGTTNDAAHALGISKNIKKALQMLEENETKKVDIYKANEVYFVYAAAVGKFSKVSYEINRRSLRFLGQIGYFINTFRDFFIPYKMKVKIITKDQIYTKNSFLIIISSGIRVAGFNLKSFTNVRKLNHQKIGVRVFTRNHMLSWFKMVWFYLFKGRHFKNDLHLDVEKISIELNEQFVWNIDGEKGPSGNLEIEVMPLALEVYVNISKKAMYF